MWSIKQLVFLNAVNCFTWNINFNSVVEVLKNMDYLKWLEKLIQEDHTYILFLLCWTVIVNIVDFVIGYAIAHFSKDVVFSSSKAILGIVRKIGIFVLIVLFIPFVLILPNVISVPSLCILLIGYILSEMYSIASHLGLVKDGNKQDHFTKMIQELFSKFFGGGNDANHK